MNDHVNNISGKTLYYEDVSPNELAKLEAEVTSGGGQMTKVSDTEVKIAGHHVLLQCIYDDKSHDLTVTVLSKPFILTMQALDNIILSHLTADVEPGETIPEEEEAPESSRV